MVKLTSAQYNVVDSALGHTGYLSIYEDQRIIKAMVSKGFIEVSSGTDASHGFIYKLTIDGIIAAMCYITNDNTGAVDSEMVRFITKLNKFEVYANRYSKV